MDIEFKPKGKWVLIEAVKPDGGLIEMPDINMSQDKRAHQQSPAILRVLAVGDGRMASDGTIVPTDLVKGDEIILAPNSQMATPDSMLYATGNKLLVDVIDIIAVVKGRFGNMLPTAPPPPLAIAKKRLVGIA